VDCDIYDSETKEVKTWSITKVFDNLKENELSLENAYIKMMGTFNNSEFI
jgi:fructose-bisphosphate aldolase class 1